VTGEFESQGRHRARGSRSARRPLSAGCLFLLMAGVPSLGQTDYFGLRLDEHAIASYNAAFEAGVSIGQGAQLVLGQRHTLGLLWDTWGMRRWPTVQAGFAGATFGSEGRLTGPGTWSRQNSVSVGAGAVFANSAFVAASVGVGFGEPGAPLWITPSVSGGIGGVVMPTVRLGSFFCRGLRPRAEIMGGLGVSLTYILLALM
jgi:hypothetical protein